MQKYSIGQVVDYSAELFLIRGKYKKLHKAGRGRIVEIYTDGYYHIFTGIRYALVHKSDII
jgi:hypothetical protein